MAKEKQKGLVAPMRMQLKPLDYHQREAQSPQQKLLKQALSQATTSSPLNQNSVANNESGSIDVVSFWVFFCCIKWFSKIFQN